MVPGKKTLIAIVISASAVVLAAGTALGLHLYADNQARSSFETANEDLRGAQQAHRAAVTAFEAATSAAHTAHTQSTALYEVTDESLLSAPEVKVALAAALTRLAMAAQFDADSNLEHGNGTSNEPDTNTATDSAAPSSRDELTATAEDFTAQAVTLRSEATATEAHTISITQATKALNDQARALVIDVHMKAVAIEVPELASQESKDTLAAAIAELQQPASGADLAALVKTYQDSLAAVVASNAEAMQASDPASIEPTYIRGILVVNKSYALPSWFGDGLTAETQTSFESMQAEAASLGLHIYISSGFRSYWAQESIYNRYVAADGRAEADRYSARPGHSEHQSGLTFDLNTIDEAFAYTAEGEWVRDNAHRFGFVIRYPQGKEHITGYIWEPWHLRHLGVDIATELYNSGLTLEEHLGITSQYAN